MRDLFKRLSPEQKNRDHMSRQFTYVFHGSDNNLPVHTLPGWNVGRQLDESEENVHPSSFHAGSQRAAMDDRFKTYVHVYKIPREHMSEIVRGDTVEDNSYADEAMHGVQSQLFETSPLKADEIADNAYSDKPRVDRKTHV